MAQGTNFADAKVLCPFYLRTDKKEIICEGLDEHATNILRFGRAEYCQQYRARYCNRDFKSCEICRAASHKYI